MTIIPIPAAVVEAGAKALPMIESGCPDPQCGDSTWDHECQLGGPGQLNLSRAQAVLVAALSLGETHQQWRVLVHPHDPQGPIFSTRVEADEFFVWCRRSNRSPSIQTRYVFSLAGEDGWETRTNWKDD